MENTLAVILENTKCGGTTDFFDLFQKYHPVVLGLKKKYYLKDLDHDDWLQEGRIVMYQSLKTYQIERGVSFGKYFKTNLERRVCSLLRKQNATKRAGEAIAQSLDEKLEVQGENFFIREELVVVDSYHSVFIRNKLEKFHERLSDFEKMILGFFIKGSSVEQIAEELDVKESKVKNALDRGKRKLKTYLLSD